MAENKNILEVHHLKKSFTTGKKSFTAVEDISFSLKTGEVLGIVGESGSGKSTVAKMITHLTEPTAGEIFLMEKDITHARGKNLREIYRKMQIGIPIRSAEGSARERLLPEPWLWNPEC